MSQTDRTDMKTRIAEGLGAFLQRNRKVIVIGLIAIAVGLVGFFIYAQVAEARLESSTSMVENLQQDYDQWLNADEGETRTELRESILEDAEEIISTYPNYYAAARALFIRANIHWEREEYAEAAADYRQLADNHRDSHLAPVGLYNASAALEESGNTEESIAALETLLSRYREDNAPEVPRALFSLGRIHEQQGEYQTAADHYRDLVDSYSDSSWTSLARDRIIWLTTQGQIESESGQS